MDPRYVHVIDEYKSIEELTTERLRNAILGGVFKPGDRLKQHQLAAYSGVSRMPVRTALRRLEAEGLVTIMRGGAYVSRLSIDDVEELYAMRVGLEGLAARVGAERATSNVIEMMRTLLGRMEEAVDTQDIAAFLEFDKSFHGCHYQASGRPRLVRKIRDLWYGGERYMRVSAYLAGTLRRAMAAHRRLLEVCESRNGRLAEQITRDYLDYSAKSIIARLKRLSVGQSDVTLATTKDIEFK